MDDKDPIVAAIGAQETRVVAAIERMDHRLGGMIEIQTERIEG